MIRIWNDDKINDNRAEYSNPTIMFPMTRVLLLTTEPGSGGGGGGSLALLHVFMIIQQVMVIYRHWTRVDEYQYVSYKHVYKLCTDELWYTITCFLCRSADLIATISIFQWVSNVFHILLKYTHISVKLESAV